MASCSETRVVIAAPRISQAVSSEHEAFCCCTAEWTIVGADQGAGTRNRVAVLHAPGAANRGLYCAVIYCPVLCHAACCTHCKRCAVQSQAVPCTQLGLCV